MYGGGWIGKTVEVVKRRIVDEDCGIIYDSEGMYPHLIGKKGFVSDAMDDRYDSPCPTGHETITLIIDGIGEVLSIHVKETRG